MACVAVNSLVRTLELEFMQPRPRPIVLKYHLIYDNIVSIQSLHQKLETLIEMFDENRMDGVEAIKGLEMKLRDVAFGIEDEIELLIVHLSTTPMSSGVHLSDQNKIALVDKPEEENKTLPSLKLCHILQKALGDIDSIKRELVKVKNAYSKSLQGRSISHDDFPRFSEVNRAGYASKDSSRCEDKMVGKKDDCKTIKEMLTKPQDKQLKFISIEGMGGIGKTTLAKAVYDDPEIVHYFYVRAWTVASQHHNKRQMLVDLLKSVSKQDIKGDEDEGDLALRIKQGLMGQKYLIVLDDLWSTDAWDSVKNCFPDEGNGSRVILTTRIGEVAKDICSDNSLFHQMELLDHKESWNLFCEKACISCNDESLWRLVVSKCKGLPLAIVVVASLFSKLNTHEERNNIAETLLASATTTMEEEISRILSLSFKHLPHYLKACFLYLAVFPEDEEIDANVLARLWSAEGLVKGLKNESYDEVANRYIQDLKDRNLIIVSKLSCCGRKIKLFRLHDMVHALCTREGQNENLVHIVRKNGFDSTIKRFRWASFAMNTSDLPKNDLCRSIICFGGQVWSNGNYFSLKPFKLLRVLHGDGFEIDVDLFHLRYISSHRTSFRSLRRPFGTWNLQTHSSYTKKVPTNIFEIPQLQYIKCPRSESRFHVRNLNKNMRSIYRLRPRECTKEFFTKIPNLKKLWISGDECMLEDLGHSQLLEKLSLAGMVLNKCLSNDNVFHLNNLKSLRISRMQCEWSEINMFCKLPSLEVLKIGFKSYSSNQMKVEWELSEEDRFCKLIFLEIRSDYLKHWRASSESFPKLERLSLTNCKLKEIPAEFPNLKLIKLKRCYPSVVDLARQIQEEQLDLGNNDMVVIEKYTRSSVCEEYDGV